MPVSKPLAEWAMGQLGRILLSSTSGSPDEHAAVLGEGGSYGELMDEIDRVLEDVPQSEPDRPGV